MRNALIVFTVFFKILVLVDWVTPVVSGGNNKSGLELQASLSSLLARNTAEEQLVFQSKRTRTRLRLKKADTEADIIEITLVTM